MAKQVQKNGKQRVRKFQNRCYLLTIGVKGPELDFSCFQITKKIKSQSARRRDFFT